MKEEHKEVLKAWIDGATIQYQNVDGLWSDRQAYENCSTVWFSDGAIYSIKPKEIVTTTLIEIDKWYTDKFIHSTFTNRDEKTENLKLTWSPDGKTLLKAEVI